ncbi:toprim domain-containing protein [Endozoicomonas ascidiicola]|uniref:toprim domain-containing protein n=1 Tax=Endozoicomonas ascidiicola TaxID=1698521 RepID=UPI000A3E0617|nr:toprim domain-containing protein [Endozoicomonas ascidiicola]
MYSQEIQEAEIVDALLNDRRFDFKDKGEYLRKGICPSCNKKELFVRKRQPWQVKCSREGNCQYEETTRNLLPELFTNYSERFPKTKENPHATADAYLAHNRHFDLGKIKGSYQQEAWRDTDTGEYCDTIRFYLDDKKSRYWERLIDKSKGNGQRANFGGQRKEDGSVYRGDVWMPAGMKIAKGDQIWIVEGIFHAIALMHAGKKAVAAFSCNNFPENLINQHKKKDVTWVIALDNEPAGRKYSKKHIQKLKAINEACAVALAPPEKDSGDWDDLYRAGKLNDKFFELCFYRAQLFMAESPEEKAYFYYLHNQRRQFVLDYGNAIYSFKKGAEVDDALAGDKKEGDGEAVDIKSNEGKELFIKYVEIDRISNCTPRVSLSAGRRHSRRAEIRISSGLLQRRTGRTGGVRRQQLGKPQLLQ